MLRSKWIRLVKTILVYLFVLAGSNSLSFFSLQSNHAIAATKILARSEPLDDQIRKPQPDPTLEQQRQQLRERQRQIRQQYQQEWSQQQQQWRNQQKMQQQESREYRRQDRERIYQRNELRREQEKNRLRQQLIIQPRH